MNVFVAESSRFELAQISGNLERERRCIVEGSIGVDEAGLQRLAVEADAFDVLLLAQGAPGIDAIAAVRSLRRAGRDVPIAVLARARTRLVETYQAGADDFLVKPLQTSELVCRLDALVRRRFGFAAPHLSVGELTIFLDGRQPLQGERPLPLDARLLDTLLCLARHAGRAVTREALYAALYGHDGEVGSEVIKVHVCRLRQRLAAAGIDRGIIETVSGGGYRLKSA